MFLCPQLRGRFQPWKRKPRAREICELTSAPLACLFGNGEGDRGVEGASLRLASMRRHLTTVLVLYLLDALVLSQGAITVAVAAVMILIAVFLLARGLGGDRRRLRHGAAMLALYSALVASVLLTISSNNRLAQRRAEALLVALKLYQAQHGDYPRALGALVPGYAPSVPSAKYTVLGREFLYRYDPASREGFLGYTAFPPFGRRLYSLQANGWGYID